MRTGTDDGLGCAQIVTGDLFGNGRQDVVILWEGAALTAIEVLRNDEHFAFTDRTLASVGAYLAPGAPNYRLVDVNGDGALDIVARSFGENASRLATGSFILLNDGHGAFSKWLPQSVGGGPLVASQLTTVTGCDWCGLLPLVFDVDGDGRTDILLVDFQSSVTAAPVQTSAVHLTAMLARSPFALPPIVEYYHAAFDHYFMTSIADEIAKLDGGAYVGWARTGQAFNPNGTVPWEAAVVCRFFSTAFGPKSSHFYTPDPTECEAVKRNVNWQFEGPVFRASRPDAAGRCSAGMRPVYRLYNNGQGAAPNHRYTTSLGTRARMLERGWIPEGHGPRGVIMCAM